MTKWTLPEGREPITDDELVALTRRLVGSSIDYKEKYEAAVRDAEEAKAYAAELEAKLAKAMIVVEMIASADVDAVLGQAVDLSCEIIGDLMEEEDQ